MENVPKLPDFTRKCGMKDVKRRLGNKKAPQKDNFAKNGILKYMCLQLTI